ncbi:MAG: hypothetical protein ACJAQT_002969 [Akkermansiaceae bacterium]|jgi:hypothetical protein
MGQIIVSQIKAKRRHGLGIHHISVPAHCSAAPANLPKASIYFAIQ